MNINEKGLLIVLSDPFGTEKATVINEILARSDNYSLSVSYTTREPKDGEIDGVDYNFVSADEFLKLVEDGEMLEYTYRHGNYYGTPLKNVIAQLEDGINVILDVSVNSASNVKALYPDAVLVLLLPPDSSYLDEGGRSPETAPPAEEVENTPHDTERALEYYRDFDYVVIVDDALADEAALSITSIADSEKHKIIRNLHIPQEFLQN